MTVFTIPWDATFISEPASTELAKLGAGRITDLKSQLTARMQVDHSWAGDANDGKHNKVTLRAQGAFPSLDATDGALFSFVATDAATELFYGDSAANVVQLTEQGNPRVPPASIIVWGSSINLPGGFAICNGQAISRTANPACFFYLGTTFGAGDGVTTFNLPNQIPFTNAVYLIKLG